MNATKAEIIQNVEGQLIKVEVSAENLEIAASVRGYVVTGYYSNPGTRAELQGAPRFKGLAGPFYGGPGIVRYEDHASNKELSA